jgi:hypothetical protein
VCPAADPDDDGNVTIDNAVSGVDSALNGCKPPTIDVAVLFSAPGNLSGGRIFLRYPDELVRIPGQGAESPQVQSRISVPWSGGFTPNDLDYALFSTLVAEPFFDIEPDELFTVDFDLCDGSTRPTAEDFRCTVFDAFGADASDVTEQTSCSVELP